ncbi:MAG: class I SAM-dependent methyltransferase [Saprospiraceae bacterium]
MNWKEFWNNKAVEQNPSAQVARIKSGEPISRELLQMIADKIILQLELKSTDEVLDVCCGNGMLSSLLANHCKSIDGIDLSSNQIQQAKKNNTQSNVSYYEGNAIDFNLNKKYDKILLYFSFQYFDQKGEGEKAIQNLLQHSKSNCIILIGDIPDSNRKIYYFPNFIELLKYSLKRILNKSDMGKFWSKKEMEGICNSLNVQGHFMKQESWQPYSHYRFDYFIFAN